MCEKPMLSIIIVNYNGLRYLKECFSSIEERCFGISYEVIFVDNNSADESVQFVEHHYPWVKVVKSQQNLGFSKGNNLGVENSKGKYLLLLNNDTVLLDDLSGLLDVIAYDDIGVVGGRMFGEHREERLSFGFFPTPLMMLKLSQLYMHRLEGEEQGDLLDVGWIEGSLLLTERETWDLVDGLDPKYFMYVEDVDFCKKVSLLGLRRVCFSKFRYIHYGGYGASRSKWLKDGFRIYANNFSLHGERLIFLLFVEIGFGLRNVKTTLRSFAASIREKLYG